jgi:hypothetical protein
MQDRGSKTGRRELLISVHGESELLWCWRNKDCGNFAEGTAVLPADPAKQPAHLKKDVKARRIIIDGVKDHIIPHLSGKKTTKDMWEALTKLYQSDNQSRKMLLREKLRSTKMARGESVATYLTKFTQIRDELAVVGETVDEIELVRIALNGFTKQWDVFVRGVVAQGEAS